jgi:hypothetical protein
MVGSSGDIMYPTRFFPWASSVTGIRAPVEYDDSCRRSVVSSCTFMELVHDVDYNTTPMADNNTTLVEQFQFGDAELAREVSTK